MAVAVYRGRMMKEVINTGSRSVGRATTLDFSGARRLSSGDGTLHFKTEQSRDGSRFAIIRTLVV